jgi:hypothetical protein
MKRVLLLLLAILALLAAIWAGWLRSGWVWPTLHPSLAAAHGPLMVSAFLGTVISLERAVALDKRWTYLVPLITGIGGLLLIFGISWIGGSQLLAVGSLGLVLLFALIVRQHPAIYTVVMAGGAIAWFVGNALQLAGRPIYIVTPWWVAFLVLTIAGERLELDRVLRLSRSVIRLFALVVIILALGIILSVFRYDLGVRLVGASLILLAGWLLRFDIAGRNLSKNGLTRFIAVCLFSGYLWLGIGGVLWLLYGGVPAGPIYDAILHSVFLGFVFAMIFGHAPLIFPAILNRPMAYSSLFYLPLIALHLSLALRVIGDLIGDLALRRWGGLLNGLTLLLFLLVTASALMAGRRPSSAPDRVL